MDFKISNYIGELLSHYGQVKVKGLGTFVSYDQEVEPGKDFQLNPDLDENILLKHINATTRMDLTQATKLVTDEVGQIKNLVESGELVYLKNIGHLYRNFLGKSIFMPEKSEFNQKQFLYPELELKPISSEEIAEVKALVKKPSKSKFQLSKLSTIAPIAVLLLACVLTWSLISNKSKSNKTESFTKLPVSEERINKKPVYTPPVEKKKDLDGVYESKVDTESATSNPNEKECVIIVGQFKSKDGARRRVSEIYDFGFAAYQDQANGLHRVGIQFPYETSGDINRKMREVKEKFDLDSWVLKD